MLQDAEEARRRGGFAPPEDWRAIIETAMAQKRSSGKTNEAVGFF